MRRILSILTIALALPCLADIDMGELATLDNIDTARSRLIERKGRAHELGTGWGYKIYDFTSDQRMWELDVPRLTASMSSSGTWDHCDFASFATYGTTYIPGTPPADCVDGMAGYYRFTQIPFIVDSWSIFKEVIATSNKYSTSGSQYVDWRVCVLQKDNDRHESADDYAIEFAATNIAIGVSGQPYLWGGVELKNEVYQDGAEIGQMKDTVITFATNTLPTVGSDNYILTHSYNGTVYTNDLPAEIHVTYHSFKVNSITYNGYTATVNVGYTAETTMPYIYLKTDLTFGYDFNNWFTWTRSSSFNLTLTTAQALETTTAHADHVITDYNQHMVYDGGLKCTWEIACTNGIFYTRKVSNRDYRKNEFAD